MASTARAIVCRGHHASGGWRMEKVKLRALKDDELLVRIVASGICHTDIMFGNPPAADGIGGYPRVMGHEGSGYVVQVGANVTAATVGDPVLLSFAACLKCGVCEAGHTSHCTLAGEINFVGTKTFFSEGAEGSKPDILGSFFGQSSFASLSIANESSVVNVKGLVRSDEELRMFAPLGCGLQTGSGTILNVAHASPADTVAIMGAGAVGLAAVMAAKIAGCKMIVVIDRVDSRLQIAKELGATHVINTNGWRDLDELVKQVRDITGGQGTTITMDATGVMALIERGIEFTARRGQYIQVGSTKPQDALSIPVQDFMASGKRFIGAVEGQVIPQDWGPQMIQWYREGKFPFARLMKQYPADEFLEAIEGMESGNVIKPIITW